MSRGKIIAEEEKKAPEMIFIHGPKEDYCRKLAKTLDKRSFKTIIYTDSQALASAFKRETPEVLFYDLRFVSDVPRLLEKVYLELPEVIVVAIADKYLEIFEQYADQIFLPHIDFERIVDGIIDNVNDRQLLASCDFVGRSVELIGVARMIEQVAPTEITVLVTGPSGAGKEMVARAIHKKSGKPDAKFVSLNIGSLAPGVLESELFGHEKGSFTGAIGKRIGHFEQASGGTLFLDEIGELPPDLQIKLLRILEEKSFYRVGGKEKISTDARLIFATNKDLGEEVAVGRFRQDLYYRLNVVNIAVLPLIARSKDIPVLVKEFLKRSRYADFAGGNPIEPGALRLFMKYHWPGNIRELKNVVESLLILSEKGIISQAAFEKYLSEKSFHDSNLPVPTGHTPATAEHKLILQAILSLKDEINALRKLMLDNIYTPPAGADRLPEQEQSSSLDDHEKNLISKTLKEVNGNRKKAAKLLGIGERTLYRKIARYGL